MINIMSAAVRWYEKVRDIYLQVTLKCSEERIGTISDFDFVRFLDSAG